MPSDLVFKSLNAVHRTLLVVSGGRIGREARGMPVLELVTTGRRSGAPRTVMLTSPLQEGDTYVVVAPQGGDDRHPAWFLNLRDEPQVEVSARGGPRTGHAAEPYESDPAGQCGSPQPERARSGSPGTLRHRLTATPKAGPWV